MDKLAVGKKYEAYSYTGEKSGKIVIASSDESYTFEFPVTYAGYPDDLLNTMPTTVRSGIKFLNDGLLDVNDMTGGTGENEYVSTFSVTTLNYKYRLVQVVYDGTEAKEITSDASWINLKKCLDDEHKYNVSVKESFKGTEDARQLYLYVLPPKYMEECDFNVDFPGGKFNNKRNIAIPVSIKAAPKPGFEVELYNPVTVSAVRAFETVRITDPGLIEKFGTDNIYSLELSSDDFDKPNYQIRVKALIADKSYPRCYAGTGAAGQDGDGLKDWFLTGKMPGTPSNNEYWTMRISDLKSYPEIPAGDTPVEIVRFNSDYTFGKEVIGVLVLRKK